MSRLIKQLDARRARFEKMQAAMKVFREATESKYGSSYAYMAGFLESQLLSLAADRLDSTEDLIRDLNHATKSLQTSV
jgi:hypothetical protein